MSVSSIHANFAWVVIFANAIAGVWSLGAHQWAALRVRALWWFIIAAEVTIFVQVALGVANLAGGRAPNGAGRAGQRRIDLGVGQP